VRQWLRCHAFNPAWTISKGVFTEMYAASGTAFTRTLTRRRLTGEDQATPGTGGVGNTAYPIAEPAAAAVHAGLKAWQRSHCRTYDMTIDPLSAPKAIPVADQVIFHRLGLALRGRDLDFFGGVLDLAESGRLADIPQFTAEQIESSTSFYRRIDEATVAAYRAAGLVYDAQDNPFIH
jgi:anaerobic magnesium-protoporphyrin IX monomethyl ester cyclase